MPDVQRHRRLCARPVCGMSSGQVSAGAVAACPPGPGTGAAHEKRCAPADSSRVLTSIEPCFSSYYLQGGSELRYDKNNPAGTSQSRGETCWHQAINVSPTSFVRT